MACCFNSMLKALQAGLDAAVPFRFEITASFALLLIAGILVYVREVVTNKRVPAPFGEGEDAKKADIPDNASDIIDLTTGGPAGSTEELAQGSQEEDEKPKPRRSVRSRAAAPKEEAVETAPKTPARVRAPSKSRATSAKKKATKPAAQEEVVVVKEEDMSSEAEGMRRRSTRAVKKPERYTVEKM